MPPSAAENTWLRRSCVRNHLLLGVNPLNLKTMAPRCRERAPSTTSDSVMAALSPFDPKLRTLVGAVRVATATTSIPQLGGQHGAPASKADVRLGSMASIALRRRVRLSPDFRHVRRLSVA